MSEHVTIEGSGTSAVALELWKILRPTGVAINAESSLGFYVTCLEAARGKRPGK